MEVQMMTTVDEQLVKRVVSDIMHEFKVLRCTVEMPAKRECASRLATHVTNLRNLGWQASFHSVYELVHVYPISHIEVIRPDAGTGHIGLSSISSTDFLTHAANHIRKHITLSTNPFKVAADQRAVNLLENLVRSTHV